MIYFFVFLWVFVYSIFTAISITLVGARNLISGNLWSYEKIIHLIFDYRFICAILAAIVARMSFIMTNNALLKIPRLAHSSTTITTFITLVCLIFVVISNIIFLGEEIKITQMIGGTIIMAGVFIILY